MPDKTEADWAVMYAEERKLRIKIEERYASFMLEVPIMLAAVDDFIEAVLVEDMDPMHVTKALMKCAVAGDDLGFNVSYGIFDPVWDTSEETRQKLFNSNGGDDIPESYKDMVNKILLEANKATHAKWEKFAKSSPFITEPAMQKEQTKINLFKVITGRMTENLRESKPKDEAEH
jgi:hypothetical protein